MKAQSFKGLILWQKAFQLTEDIYKQTDKLPTREAHSLTDQMRRAAISICSNIAEGYERNNRKEYVHFLAIARGSSAELESLILLAQSLYGLDLATELSLLQEVQKLLWTFNKKLKF